MRRVRKRLSPASSMQISCSAYIERTRWSPKEGGRSFTSRLNGRICVDCELNPVQSSTPPNKLRAVWEPSSSSPTRTTLSVLDVLRDFNSIIFGGGGDQDRPWTMHARWPVQESYAREIASLSASLRSGAISSSSSSPSIEVMVEISRACCELRDTINGVLNGTVGSRVVDPLEVEFLNAALRAMAAAY